jgi:hypothetical protein
VAVTRCPPARPASVTILDAPAAGAPPGVYVVETAFLDPKTGVTLGRHTLAVVKD